MTNFIRFGNRITDDACRHNRFTAAPSKRDPVPMQMKLYPHVIEMGLPATDSWQVYSEVVRRSRWCSANRLRVPVTVSGLDCFRLSIRESRIVMLT